MSIKLKHLLLVLFFLFSGFLLRAQEQDFKASDEFVSEEEEEAAPPEKKEFRLKNRAFELSIANMSVSLSNDFIAAKDYIQKPGYIMKNFSSITEDTANLLLNKDKLVVDIDDILSSFKFNFNAIIKPLSVNFNHKDQWGWGLDIAHINVTGNLSLLDNLLDFDIMREETFGAGGAVFLEVFGIPVFFHVNDFRVKIKPAVYLPLLYAEPGITYKSGTSSHNGNEGIKYELAFDMYVYSPVNMQNLVDGEMNAVGQYLGDNYWDIARHNLGYDLGLGLEYPLFSWLDLGADIVNLPIPFLGARLNNYMHWEDNAYIDTSYIDLADIISSGGDYEIPDETFKNFESEPDYNGHNAKGVALYRPFTMLFYADYRPFDRHIISLHPSLGFSINRLYPKIGAVEGGLNASLDLGNIFVTTFGINYNDRKWINSFDLILNFKVLELDIGLSMQSPNFKKSWQGAGVGVNFGLKLGF